MARGLKRRDTAQSDYWTHQPVGSSEPSTLDPDDAQLGRGSFASYPLHSDRNATSNYLPGAVVETSPLPRAYRRRYGRGGRGHPYTSAAETVYRPAGQPEWTQNASQIPTGAPSSEVVQGALHEPVTGAELRNMGLAQEQRPSVLRRLFGGADAREDASDSHVMAMGGTLEGRVRNTVENLSPQRYQVPNIRQTANTPAIPGVSIVNGRPYVQKAGNPVTDVPFAAQREHVDGNEYDVLPTHAAQTFTGDANRTQAGAQDPAAPDNRPARSDGMFGPEFSRKFDQLIAHNLTGMKGVRHDPRAASPLVTEREQIGPPGFHYGAQGGDQSRTNAPGMQPFGMAPNTDRQIPGAWDYDLTNYSPPQTGRRRYGRG